MKMQMLYQGLRMEDYLKYTNTTEEDLRERFRGDAANGVKTELVIDAIAKQENLEASGEEVDDQIARYAKDAHQDLETYKAGITENQLENFKDLAVSRKVIELIKTSAQISIHEGEHHDEPVDVQEVLESVTEALAEEPGEEPEEQQKPAKKAGKKSTKQSAED
jgi:trigger factor